MSIQLSLVTFLGTVLVAIATTNLQYIPGTIDGLHYVGTANGSRFYADRGLTLDWRNASQLCNAAGMHLARINTVEQVPMLKASNITATGAFWIGAKESHIISRFLWDLNGETPNGQVLRLASTGQITFCLYYAYGAAYTQACSSTRDLHPLYEQVV